MGRVWCGQLTPKELLWHIADCGNGLERVKIRAQPTRRQEMPLRPGEEPGNAIAVFPFLKTREPIRLGSLTFRSTDDTRDLEPADATHVAEIASMLFLQDDLRIRSASYAVLPPLDLDRPGLPWRLSAGVKTVAEAKLRELEHLQTIIAYCYSAPHETLGHPFLRFEHASLAIFSPEPVFLDLVRPRDHVERLFPEHLPDKDAFDRVEGYRGLYNFRQHFWVAKGSRCYPPVPHLDLNIGQDLCSDLGRCFGEAPQHHLLPGLLRQPTSATADRVLTALGWYNRANSLVNDDHAAIVDLATAFETLLGLPQEAKKEQLNSALFLLLGRTPRLPEWEKQFYAARSEVVHSGRASRLRFVPPHSKGGEEPYRELLADGRQIFQLCVGTLLFGAYLAERAGLAEKMVPNQERLEHICKILDSGSLTAEEKLSGVKDTVALACRYQFVPDPGLLNETLIGAAQRVAKTFLACASGVETPLKDSFERLATAPRSADWYEALDALRSLNEPRAPLPEDRDSPQAIAQQLISLVWRYTFSNYCWLKEARSKQQSSS